MIHYLDPKTDVVFKKIFGNHAYLLMDFLNAVLPLPAENTIVELEYLSNEQISRVLDGKNSIADVRCRDAQGRAFVVEMQIAWSDSFQNRLLFESCVTHAQQLKRGEDYRSLQPTYGLALVNAIFDRESESGYHRFRMTREGTPGRVMENLEVILIELPKMHGKLHQLDRGSLWLRFMMEIGPETREVAPELLAIPTIREAIELAKEAGYSEAEMYLYDRNWDAISRERTLIVDARLAGKVEGKVEGKAEGKVEGEALSNQKILQAIQGLEAGHDMQYVLATTKIAPEILEKLCQLVSHASPNRYQV